MQSVKPKEIQQTAVLRLQKDYAAVFKDPIPYILVGPKEGNLLECHYVICGPEESPYEGGYYHGKLVFPHEYPFKPPSIYMITPNGRFKCNKKLCLTMSDYHPEHWNPSWSVSTILTGLLSFMLEDKKTAGSTTSTMEEKRRFARESLSFNISNPEFCEVFPDLAQELKEEIAEADTDSESSAEKDNDKPEVVVNEVKDSCIKKSTKMKIPLLSKILSTKEKT